MEAEAVGERELPKIPSPEVPPPCPNTVTVRRNPPRRARPTPSTFSGKTPASSAAVRLFPLEDISSLNLNTIEVPAALPSAIDDSKNLKVFLRIKAVGIGTGLQQRDVDDLKIRARNVWPQNPAKLREQREKPRNKKTTSEPCITVNSSTSVLLSPPATLQESKRIRAESYEGFSHVFSAQSSQNEVYKRMVEPLVEDFLRGRNGMLTALGPSGSGKTYTVFGNPREPGIVPLALRQILNQRNASSNRLSRYFYLSMFEISSERGKGEKVFDLSSGVELVMQQSTIRGLQEVAITDIGQAEALIACGMLKRATAMTNTNNQSSRSQCIINIRSDEHDGESHGQSNAATLTFVDIAGAEREKRTGNQGKRLLESNFINNTSMVFSLCLRSLLEHQKNPKKPLQKHFQSSLLTRYLRDYLEGKKRMSLILTVKPEEEDYLATSYLLRQASPFMKIMLNNVEESSTSLGNKRQIQKPPRLERPKRMKVKREKDDASVSEVGKTIDKDWPSPQSDSRSKLDTEDSKSASLNFKDKGRHNQIMLPFTKAIWKVLKQYNTKIKVAESEIQALSENLANEKTRTMELEKELKSLKDSCTCTKKNSINATLAQIDVACVPEATRTSSSDETEGRVHSSLVDIDECNRSPNECQTPVGHLQIKHPVLADSTTLFGYVFPNPNNTAEHHDLLNDTDTISEVTELVGHVVNASNLTHKTSDEQSDQHIRKNDGGCVDEKLVYPCLRKVQDSELSCISGFSFADDIAGQESDATIAEVTGPVGLGSTECQLTSDSSDEGSKQPIKIEVENCGAENLGGDPEELGCLEMEDDCRGANLEGADDCLIQPLDHGRKDSCSTVELDWQLPDEGDKVSCNQPALISDNESRSSPVSKSVDEPEGNIPEPVKPRRRRLVPAKALLDRDVSSRDIEDEIEKPKGTRGKRSDAIRTKGSTNLLKLLTT